MHAHSGCLGPVSPAGWTTRLCLCHLTPAAVPLQAANVAKHTGVLELEDHMSVAVLNSHLTYCYARRRPYLAIGKHGRRIVVDLLPVAGLGPSANATR